MADTTRMIASDDILLPPKTENISAMSKLILTASIILLLLYSGLVSGQESQCPRFKVCVKNDGVYNDSTLYYLNKRHNKDLTIESWISEINSKIVEELNNAGSSDLTFFSSSLNPEQEIDLFFYWSLKLWSVNKDHPDNKYANSYIKDGILNLTNQKIVFLMRSQINILSPCVPNYESILSIETTYEENIYQLTKNLVGMNSPLDRQIWDWESQHLAPAREPQMEVRYEKEYLSLLDEESRKTEIYIKVKNCRDQYVYNQFHSQPVYFLKETDRLQSRNSNKCDDGPPWGPFITIFTNAEFEAICAYSVKKGLNPSIEKLRFQDLWYWFQRNDLE